MYSILKNNIDLYKYEILLGRNTSIFENIDNLEFFMCVKLSVNYKIKTYRISDFFSYFYPDKNVLLLYSYVIYC